MRDQVSNPYTITGKSVVGFISELDVKWAFIFFFRILVSVLSLCMFIVRIKWGRTGLIRKCGILFCFFQTSLQVV